MTHGAAFAVRIDESEFDIDLLSVDGVDGPSRRQASTREVNALVTRCELCDSPPTARPERQVLAEKGHLQKAWSDDVGESGVCCEVAVVVNRVVVARSARVLHELQRAERRLH